MLTATLFVLFLVICPTQAQNSTDEEVLKTLQNAWQTVQLALEEILPANAEAAESALDILAKIPSNADAREKGNAILATLELAVKSCDENLKKDLQFVTYNVCVVSNKELEELAGQQWAKSGASRPGLFW
ncbi:hypothetical protein ACLKA7_009334 [Drosophila subpalustris]